MDRDNFSGYEDFRKTALVYTEVVDISLVLAITGADNLSILPSSPCRSHVPVCLRWIKVWQTSTTVMWKCGQF